MKNFKKITLGILGATILSLGLYACSNDDATTANNNTTTEQSATAAKEGNIQKFYGRIPLPAEFENDATANFYAVIDVENEVVLEYKIEESVATAYKIDHSQLNELFRNDMGGLLTSLNGEPGEGKNHSHSGCMKACREEFPTVDGVKTPGLGKCKAACWVDTAVVVAQKVLEFIKETKS